MASSPYTQATDTVVLLLPEIPGVEECTKKILLTLHGVLGVAVHSFNGHIGKNGEITKKYYCSVTYNSCWVTQDKIREAVQSETKKKPVYDVTLGKLKKTLQADVKTEEDDGKAEVFHLNDEDDESAAEHDGHYGGATLNDNLNDWYNMGDSDSDDDEDNYENEEGLTGNSSSGGSGGAKSGNGGKKQKAPAGYLNEDAGKPRHFVNMFAPLVGGFDVNTAQLLTEEYNTWAVQPFDTEDKKEEKSILGTFKSFFFVIVKLE